MANNRLWLVHRPSGESVYLGKRMALGWYHGASEEVGSELREFYERCEKKSDRATQDDFVLVMEDAHDAPGALESSTQGRPVI